jgi:soluble lytic murein transglycosylase-like protein
MNIILKLSVALFAATLFMAPAQAACSYSNTCHEKVLKKKKYYKSKKQSVAGQGQVVAMIKKMAPKYGVPTWFALRIAKVESNYNPRARGAAGEYGVYQMKCATAKGIGFRGNCSGLANAHTNIQYGLKHLSLAVKSSRGNLKLAASKHNGGLGRKRLVPRYVAMVF